MNLYGSKQNTEYIVNRFKEIINFPNIDNIFIAGMLAMFHTIFGVFIIISICFININNNVYNFVILGWLLIIYSNYYFHGCILTRVERALYKDNNWYGPATLFFYVFNLEQNKNKVNNTIKYFLAFPFSVILIIRMFFSRNYYRCLILFIILTPLLFINSQALLFNKLSFSKKINTPKINTPKINTPKINTPKINAKLKDKNVVVSGASSGIGLALIKKLLYNEANVICLMRNSKHAEENYKKLKREYSDKINWVEVDFMSLKSIKNAIENIKTICKDGIDVLFNNAGITNTNPNLTEDGYEAQIQTNCISHIVLTEGILTHIEKCNGVIINHSSLSYNIPSNSYNYMFFKKHTSLDSFKGVFISQHLYQQSKLGQILYTQTLQNRLKDKNIRVISFHPGICKTNLFKSSIIPSIIINGINWVSVDTNKIIPYLLDCIVSIQIKNKNLIYGPSNISINQDMINSTQVDNFQNDVVSQFMI